MRLPFQAHLNAPLLTSQQRAIPAAGMKGGSSRVKLQCATGDFVADSKFEAGWLYLTVLITKPETAGEPGALS